MSFKSFIQNLIWKSKPVNYQITGSKISDTNIANVIGDNNNVTLCISQPDNSLASISDKKLLNKVLDEKAESYHELIIDLQFARLKAELDNVFDYGVDRFNKDVAEKLYFYRFCQFYYAQDYEKCKDLIDYLDGEFKHEAEWMLRLNDFIPDSEYSTFMNHPQESQICVLGVLLQKKNTDYIFELYDYCCENGSPKDSYAISLYAAISFFNHHDSGKALKILNELDKTRLPIQFFSSFFELFNINENYLDSRHNERIVALLKELEKLQESSTSLYNANHLFIATIILESYFNLERTGNNEFLEKAEDIYFSLPEADKKADSICFYFGLCLEVAGQQDRAAEVYKTCDWKNNDRIASKIMDLYAEREDYDRLFALYDQIEEKTSIATGIYLNALDKTNNESYRTELVEASAKYNVSLEEQYFIAVFVEDSTIFHDVIVPNIQNALISGSTFSELQVPIRCGYVMKFAQHHEFQLLKDSIDVFEHLDILTDEVCQAIYKAFFDELKNQLDPDQPGLPSNDRFDLIDAVSERFVRENVYPKQFIQIRMMVSNAEKKPISKLRFEKELFEITDDPQLAANIVGDLLQAGVQDFNQYKNYLVAAGSVSNPQYLLNLALAYQTFDDWKNTELYIYKALRALNGADDYAVFGRIFAIESLNFGRDEEFRPLKHASGTSVITIKEIDGEDPITICLDGEADFSKLSSDCFGIKHINRNDMFFRKLASSSKGQVLNLNDRQYKVVNIEPRNDYVIRFVMAKSNEAPDRIKPYSQLIRSTSNEDLLSQIKKVIHQGREHRQKLIDYYNFKDNDIGFPVDIFCNRNYDEYINQFANLLFRKDGALYVGFPNVYVNNGQKIVITLSTIILAGIMDWFDIIDYFHDVIICPDSYVRFFEKLYNSEIETQARSVGKLVELEDGRMTFVDNNQKIVDILERIVTECNKFTKVMVSDTDRINYHFFPEVTGEQFPEWLGVDMIQVDAFIVAEREHAVYLSDDLFFRKLAGSKKINNINFGSLLRLYSGRQRALEVAKNLSATNYLYAPFLYSSEDDFDAIRDNMLNGELKKKYYPGYINTYLYALREVYLEYFGGEDAITDNEE